METFSMLVHRVVVVIFLLHILWGVRVIESKLNEPNVEIDDAHAILRYLEYTAEEGDQHEGVNNDWITHIKDETNRDVARQIAVIMHTWHMDSCLYGSNIGCEER